MKKIFKFLLPPPLYRRLKSIKNKYDLKHFKKSVIVRNCGGYELKIMIADSLAKGWYDLDRERLEEINFLSKYRLKTGATVLNLGAHQCVIAMILAKEVSESGKVVAVEANPHNCEISAINIKMNSIENITIVQAAVADKTGEILFSQSLNGEIGLDPHKEATIKVKSFKIDDLIKKYGKPDVVFMDIEGYEGKALSVADKAVALNCDWFIEMHGEDVIKKYSSRVEDVMSCFDEKRFKLYCSPKDKIKFSSFDRNNFSLKEAFYLIAICNS